MFAINQIVNYKNSIYIIISSSMSPACSGVRIYTISNGHFTHHVYESDLEPIFNGKNKSILEKIHNMRVSQLDKGYYATIWLEYETYHDNYRLDYIASIPYQIMLYLNNDMTLQKNISYGTCFLTKDEAEKAIKKFNL